MRARRSRVRRSRSGANPWRHRMGALTDRELQQVDRANASASTPIVFVHGLWLLPSSWDAWVAYVEENGFVALTPGWPDDPETVADARLHPDVFARKGIGEIADHMETVIRKLERRPVVIGHSFGGLLTQILAGRGLAAASVAISPAPFRGVLPLPFSALRSASAALRNPANWNRAVPLQLRQRRRRGRSERALPRVLRRRPRRAALPGRRGELQPLVGGEGGH